MNFTSLDYFIALSQERSFTKAAARLHVTQQTLSAHISQLEKEMDCKLVVRQIPLELTWAGRVFYNHALLIRKNADTMRKEISDAAEEVTGVLRLGISPNRGHAILPNILTAYTKKYPGIHVELTEGINLVLTKKLLDGDIDLTIAYFKEDMPGVTQEKFYTEEIILLVSKKLLKAIGKEKELPVLKSRKAGCMKPLADCPFLQTGGGTVQGRLALRLFAEADMNPPVIVLSDNLELLIELCAKGVGALLCPENQARRNLSAEELEGMHIIRLAHSQRQISFGYRKELRQWKPMANFISLAERVLSRQMDGIG